MKRLMLLGLALCVAACVSTRGGNIPYDVQGFGQPDPVSSVALAQNYKIAPLDVLAVNVFQVNDLSGSYQVDLTGNIAMPLIGNVRAVDLTTEALRKSIAEKLEVRYLNNPDVTVGITSSAGSNITVDGSVRQPGIFPVMGKVTLLQAIALAKGTDDTANEHRVAVFRRIDGKQMAAAFDLVSIRHDKAQDPEIYRGDIIVVDGSSAKKTYRDLLRTSPLMAVFSPLVR